MYVTGVLVIASLSFYLKYSSSPNYTVLVNGYGAKPRTILERWRGSVATGTTNEIQPVRTTGHAERSEGMNGVKGESGANDWASEWNEAKERSE